MVVDFSTVGATLKMPSPKLDMSEVKGDFRFDLAKGLSAPAVQARVLGSEVRGRIVAEGAAMRARACCSTARWRSSH